MANDFKFQPTKTAEAVQQKLFIKRLPEWMQGLEDIQKVCDDVIQQFFNPTEQKIVDGYLGDMGSPAASGKIFVNESTQPRQAYQLSPAYVSRNVDQSIRSIEFYDDLVSYMNHYGAITDNQSRLFNSRIYSWTPPINPNKMINFSSYLWDTENEYGITSPDYVVIQRNAKNGNLWSLQNFWYTIGDTLPDGSVLNDELSYDNRFVRAQVPIIEYNKDIELMNFGTQFRGVVDLLSDSLKPEDIVQKDINQGIRIDGQIPLDGMRILFTSIGNSGENNRIYKVYINQMQDGTRVYGLALDPDEETPERVSGEPLDGDVVLIKSGKVYGNTTMYWNGHNWIATQKKNGTNAFPLFQLYDRNGVKLQDSTVYPSSTFSGSSLFGLKINYNYKVDSYYGYNVELGDYNYYIYENFIESTRYEYTSSGETKEIPGFYYYNIIGDEDSVLKTDWVRSTEFSKQFVKQTPQIERTDMYRVFSTVYEMENFSSQAIDGMYAYVIETNATYQYYKEESETYYDWHMVNTEGIQSELYNRSYELAQKVIDGSSDIIEIQVNGVVVEDYTRNVSNGKVQSITIGDSVDLDSESVIQIRTYSSTEVPDTDLGSYEIPVNLQNNPYSDNISYIDQSNYTLHFQEIVQKNITSGAVDNINDYEERLEQGLVDNAVGTKIIQNEGSLLPLMAHTANSDIDLFEALMFLQGEYLRFNNRFENYMLNMYKEDPSKFLSTSSSDICDTILSNINVGKDSTFAFYYDGVGSTTTTIRTFIPPTPQFMGVLKVHKPEKTVYLTAASKQVPYNIRHTGEITKSYRVINGVDKMDDVIYELENRIYNSIDNTFKDEDYQPELDSSDLFPTPYYRDTEYSAEERDELLLRGYINFIATNGIDSTTHNYDQQNWMTWNYSGTYYTVNGVITDFPARGSWRAIYTDQFGTYRPATHPWEMFGFGVRPTWWNQEYEPTEVQVGTNEDDILYVYEALVVNESGELVPSGLWDVNGVKGDASTGTILYGDRKGQHDKYKRFGTQPFVITKTGEYSTNGKEICTVDYIQPDVLGLVKGTIKERSAPWSYGDMGDNEFTYMNNAMFSYDVMMQIYRAKPAQFCNYFWDTLNDTLKTVKTGGLQLQYKETRTRLNFNSDTVVHGENNTRVLGYQMAVSNYLTYQSKNITSKYGDLVRTSYISIAHKLGGFTKSNELTFTSESFGLISQENQTIGLVRSNNIKNEVLSAVKITFNGSNYIIKGYDLVNATFTYKLPVKNGKKVTVTEGNRTVVHYMEWKEDDTLEYGSILNTFQDVYTFLCGYGQYLVEHGWIFEDVDDTGVQQDWSTIAKYFLQWSTTDLTIGDYISCTPSSKNAKFGTYFGSVQSISETNGGVWSLLDDDNSGIYPYEVETSRIGNVFTVRVNEDADKRMALVRLGVCSWEHAVVFDDKTIFGDSIYQPTFGSIQELVKMYGYITDNWVGRLQAPGFIILEAGTLPSFETLVTNFQHYYDSNDPVSDVQLYDLSTHVIGYQTRDYLQQMITNNPNRVDFYRGFIRDKGSNLVMERVLRVSKSYNTDEYKALQEWAFKVGTYGNVNAKKNLQFQLINSDFKQEPQLVTFDKDVNTSTSSTEIVYYGSQGEDSRWITRPKGKFRFPMRSGKSDNIHLPDIGPVNLNEVSYTTWTYQDSYEDRMNYIKNNGENPDSVWMFVDMNQEWNIFDLVDTGVSMLSITPIENTDTYAEQYCTVQLDAEAPLDDGDYYYFVDDTYFMPDALTVESQYFTAGDDKTKIVVPFDTSITINFTDPDTRPKLYKYTSRFSDTTERQAYIDKKYSFDVPDSTLFDRPSTYNSKTNITELYLNIFDPINGVLPGTAMKDVSYISPVDPAQYNSNGETLQAWGSEKVGQVWWDTSTAFYLDYTRPVLDENGDIDEDATNEYRRYNWGRLLPHSDINVLEWVKSPVQPYNWDKYCQEQTKNNKNNTMYIPSGTAIMDNYTSFIEYDETTDSYVTYYYFWVRDTIYVPPINTRSKSCTDIARIIKDPHLLDVPWFAPINENSFILSNMQYEITDDTSILTVSYHEDSVDIIKHEQYQLCKEGDSYNFNSDIWNSLWNSLKGHETTKSGVVNEIVYPDVELGLGSSKTWFMDLIEARRTFVDSANNYYKTQNIITDTVLMSEVFNVKTTEVNENSVTFRVLAYNNEFVVSTDFDKFDENDAVILSSTGVLPSPLDTTSVYFVHYDSNGYIRFMTTKSTDANPSTITLEGLGEGQHSMIKQSDYVESLGTSLDMTQYWEYADWYSDGYDKNTDYTQEASLDIANTKNYQVGDVIRITDSDGWTMYVKTSSRNTVFWNAIGRQNSTIALNSSLYDGYEVYNSDGSLSNKEINVRSALDLIKNTFDLAQSNIVFDMVKYVHVEQGVVDWVFKTSYIYIVGLEQSLKQNYTNDELINQIIEYFNEVKPYRTKIRSQIEQKTSDTDYVYGVCNDLDPNGYEYNGTIWVKTQSDIWDHEYAEYNESTGQWVVVGSIPNDFVYPDRKFQEIDISMQFDNVQCQPDSDLYDVTSLEENNAKYVSNSDDNVQYYEIQRFKYTLPVVEVDEIYTQISVDMFELYSDFDTSLDLVDAINAWYKLNVDDAERTESFTSDLDRITSELYSTSNLTQDVRMYSQYNTLSNRLKLYSSMSSDVIHDTIGCGLSGEIYNDNPNTRLPFGFSSSSDFNMGYFEISEDLFAHYRELILEETPDADEETIRSVMEIEYGIYCFKYDIDSQGRYYKDAIHVLTAIRNTFDKDSDDPYAYAEDILNSNRKSMDIQAFVMIPRKYIRFNINGSYVSIPDDRSIDEYMEDLFITDGSVVTAVEIDMDDLEMDDNNPMYSDYMVVLEGIKGQKYYNDMNAYDNLGLESQYKTVALSYEGDLTESVFIDISELNPSANAISQMRFTVDGYSNDSTSLQQIKDFSRFQIEGFVVLNPYKRTEAIVSIPPYSLVQNYVNRTVIKKDSYNYISTIDSIISSTEFLMKNSNLNSGDKVMVFTPDGDDYYRYQNFTHELILSTDKIKENDRPIMFEVELNNGVYSLVDSNGNKLEFNNLTTNNTGEPYTKTSINVIRIRSFADHEFNNNGDLLYESIRNYRVDVMDYDVFYDISLNNGDYTDEIDPLDLDVWLISNELVETSDGVVDSGYFMPNTGVGTLDELVRIGTPESLEFTVYEYDVDDIKPVFDGVRWTYSYDLTDKVYIGDTTCTVTSVTKVENENTTYVVEPVSVGTYSVKDNIITGSTSYDDIIVLGYEKVHVRNNNNILRSDMYSAEHYFAKGETYTFTGINLGVELNFSVYKNYYKPIDVSVYANSLKIDGLVLNNLLNVI